MTTHNHIAWGNPDNIETRPLDTTRGTLVGLFTPVVPGCPLALAAEDFAMSDDEFATWAQVEMVPYKELGLHEIEGLWPDNGKKVFNPLIAILSPATEEPEMTAEEAADKDIEPTWVSCRTLPDTALTWKPQA
ncbi:hypothetical protein ACFL3T_01220 [Patescibacteria group bacterium]